MPVLQKFRLILHKIGIALAITNKLDCMRLALFLHKIGIALAKQVNFLCLRLALPLHINR